MGITLWCILIATPGETPAVKAIENNSNGIFVKFIDMIRFIVIVIGYIYFLSELTLFNFYILLLINVIILLHTNGHFIYRLTKSSMNTKSYKNLIVLKF